MFENQQRVNGCSLSLRALGERENRSPAFDQPEREDWRTIL